MKVLFVSPFYAPAWVYGGVPRALAAWAEALAAAGADVSVWTTTADGPRELDVPAGQALERAGVRVTYFRRLRASGNRFFSPGLGRACRAGIGEFDAVHVAGLWTYTSWKAASEARRAGIPYVVSPHGMLMPWALSRRRVFKSISYRLVEKKLLGRAAAIVCTSELERDSAARPGLPLRRPIIPNVVDLTGVRPDPAGFRARRGLENGFVFLFAGRLVRNKGVHLTLEAFARAAAGRPEARLVVVGPDEDASGRDLRRRAEALGLSKRVLFTGLLTGSDHWDALAAADVFVLNSYSENFGLAAAEALALGVPALVSDRVGIAGLITASGAGWAVPLRPDAIADTMSRILADRTTLFEKGRNAARLAGERFAPAAVGREWRALLEGIR